MKQFTRSRSKCKKNQNVKSMRDGNGHFSGDIELSVGGIANDEKTDEKKKCYRTNKGEKKNTIYPRKSKIKEIFGLCLKYIKYSRSKSIRRNEL